MGIAFAGVPAASAICIPEEPPWGDDACIEIAVLPVGDDPWVCVSTTPLDDCLPPPPYP
jgi:hypothetical protein